MYLPSIPFLNLKEINQRYADELKAAAARVIDSGWYILGEEVTQFEKEFASYCGVPFCIGVGNGLDALTLILRAYKELGVLQKGDEVIVPANTYIAASYRLLKMVCARYLSSLTPRHLTLIPQALRKRSPRRRALSWLFTCMDS